MQKYAKRMVHLKTSTKWATKTWRIESVQLSALKRAKVFGDVPSLARSHVLWKLVVICSQTGQPNADDTLIMSLNQHLNAKQVF